MATIPSRADIEVSGSSNALGIQVDTDGNIALSIQLGPDVQNFLTGSSDLVQELEDTLSEPITPIGFS